MIELEETIQSLNSLNNYCQDIQLIDGQDNNQYDNQDSNKNNSK